MKLGTAATDDHVVDVEGFQQLGPTFKVCRLEDRTVLGIYRVCSAASFGRTFHPNENGTSSAVRGAKPERMVASSSELYRRPTRNLATRSNQRARSGGTTFDV